VWGSFPRHLPPASPTNPPYHAAADCLNTVQVEELKRKFAEMQSQQRGGEPPAPMQMGGRKDEQVGAAAAAAAVSASLCS